MKNMSAKFHASIFKIEGEIRKTRHFKSLVKKRILVVSLHSVELDGGQKNRHNFFKFLKF